MLLIDSLYPECYPLVTYNVLQSCKKSKHSASVCLSSYRIAHEILGELKKVEKLTCQLMFPQHFSFSPPNFHLCFYSATQ